MDNASGSSSMSPVFSGNRSRDAVEGMQAREDDQARVLESSHGTTFDPEVHDDDGATHVSGRMANASGSRGKRKGTRSKLGAKKRQKQNAGTGRSAAWTADETAAGPSRSPPQRTDTMDSSADVLDLLETGDIESDISFIAPARSASDHYSASGELLYPEAGPSRDQRGVVADDDDSAETYLTATQLTAQTSTSTVGTMSMARILNFDDDDVPQPSMSTEAQPHRSHIAEAGSSASVASTTATPPAAASSGTQPQRTPPKLSGYNCPICFSPPTYATMTPCGHVCCGECLFTAVKTTIQRSVYHGPASSNAKCPVCRAPIPGWDGKGGGVIGLKVKVVHDISGSPKKPKKS
ncbi:hypothetical protein BXZ70DRAFT_947675 [Cristinia sonorae]|uniref:RING-type domain-containing protein n=1 Tax=Cristinia sonorae TaxID=1940300 RepID=A0A8K0XMX0_9AGAR|nr:hypothetical protein BXZ70DRAFT_947675 [Cristinia sonorae]